MKKSDIELAMHVWERTNHLAKYHAGRRFDEFQCRRCSITSKKYIHDYGMKIDKRYNDNVYLKCDTSIKELRRLRELL